MIVLRSGVHPCSFAFTLITLSSLATGCGDDGPITTSATSATTGGTPLLPGLAVDCLPDETTDTLVCMSKDVYDCLYKRAAVCARANNTVPSDFGPFDPIKNFKPALTVVHVPGSSEPTSNIDCENLGDIEDGNGDPLTVVNGMVWESVNNGCTPCGECETQIAGYNNWQLIHSNNPPAPPGWQDLFCPDTAEEIPWNDPLDPEAGCGNIGFDTTGDPTTGEPVPTTGSTTEDPTTGGEDCTPGPLATWICNGSAEICGLEIDTTIPPPDNEKDKCLSQTTPNAPPICVPATDVCNARDQCELVCNKANAQFASMYPEDGTLEYKSMPCGLFQSTQPPPVESDDPSKQCEGGGAIDPSMIPFTAYGELSLALGGEATTSQLHGLIDFEIGPCPALCEVTITQMRGWKGTLTGVYTSAPPVTTTPFNVENLEYKLMQPIYGELDPANGLITFPGERAYLGISATSAALGLMSLASEFEGLVFSTDDIAGFRLGTDLTLEFIWSYNGTSLWVELTAAE